LKKEPKTFAPPANAGGNGQAKSQGPEEQSFFASFCSQKEALPVLYFL
jgi:hypothetical protein